MEIVIGTIVPTHIKRPDEARARLAQAELVLVDLDGCLTFGSQPHAAAARFVEMFAERYVIVSNNSTETPESMAQKLRATGVPVDPDRIMLAGTLMIDELLAETDAPPVALYAAPQLTAYAERRGLRLVERNERGGSARVAIARDTTLVYDDLNKALDRLSRGARLTISNPDLTHPGIDQVPVIETGALLAIFRACIPDLEPRVIGKPEPLMFEAALRRFGSTPERAVMIGDNPLTDGAGATRIGMASILVGPLGHYASIGDLIPEAE